MQPQLALALLVLTLVAFMMAVQGCGSSRSPIGSADGGVFFAAVRAGPAAKQESRLAVYIPLGLDTSRPQPAIVFLNGRGECGTDGSKQLTVGLLPAALANPDRWPFIMIFPQKPDYDSTWEQHEELVLAAIELVQREHRVDRHRIYLTGLSQGGAGAWAIGSRHPDLFAAIAPVCGFVHDPSGAEGRYGTKARESGIAAAFAAASMPVWAFHGEKDDVIPPSHTRSMIAAIRAARPRGPVSELRETYFPNANHNSWDAAYRDTGAELAAWFLEHRREP